MTTICPENAAPGPAGLDWDEAGAPRSRQFDDKYYCAVNGYAEACYVAGTANRLTERFSSLDVSAGGVFTVLETGFGTGLDFCTVWKLWEENSPRSWTLHFISVELYPLTAAEVAQALQPWGVLAGYRERLAGVYPADLRQKADVVPAESRVRLTIVFEDAAAALARIKTEGWLDNGVDVFLLDGFAPAKNPLMWSDGVLDGVAGLSRQGTTFSTFTARGAIRRGLEARGFTVRKIAGMGGKKDMLAGIMDPQQAKV